MPTIEADRKPPLKWAAASGGKAPHLLPIWRKHRQRRLVEPFCGGLGPLGLAPDRAPLNDLNLT